MKFHNGSSDVELYDVNGTMLYCQSFVRQTQIDVSVLGIPSGVYFLRIFNGEKQIIEKVVYMP